jgi:hypothetical protein
MPPKPPPPGRPHPCSHRQPGLPERAILEGGADRARPPGGSRRAPGARPRTQWWRACRFYVLGAILLAAVILPFLPGAQMHALDAAGAFNGTPISGVQTFVDKLRGKLVWLGGTAMGLVIAVVGIMFMAGHSRAHDLAIRTIAGLAILASISGIVA